MSMTETEELTVTAVTATTEITALEFAQQVEVPNGSLVYRFEKSGKVTSIDFDSHLIQYPFTMAVGQRQELPSSLPGNPIARVPMSIFQFLDEKSPTAEEWPLATFVCVNAGSNISCRMGATQILVKVHPRILRSSSRSDLSKLLVGWTPDLPMLFDDINIRLRMMSGIGKY